MNISGRTTMLGLIGSPVGHSKSPEMYNYCFEKYGCDYAYLAFDVNETEVGNAINALKTFGLRGANVTMPLKTYVVEYMDELSPAAEAIGSVNTIINENGILKGYSTDGMGFTSNLADGGVSVADKKITLLGGGGVASAVAIQCALEGAAEISVFNRKDRYWSGAETMMKTISEKVPSCRISLYDLDNEEKMRSEIASSHLLVNANCVGMAPLENESLIKDKDIFREDLIVADVVYSPAETKLLKEAKECGCQTFSGLGMLLHQGAEAFRLYTGLEMPLEEIRQLLYS